MNEIPLVIEHLYIDWVTDPNPDRQPEDFRENPVQGHGLYAFYCGLILGFRLMDACQEQ